MCLIIVNALQNYFRRFDSTITFWEGNISVKVIPPHVVCEWNSLVSIRVLAEASSFLMSHKTNIASLDLFLQNELKWTILHFAILS